MRLKDKVAIITGGACGFGRAFAEGYAKEGAKVAMADINGEAVRSAEADLIKEGREALGLQVDVSKVDETLEMARKTVERFGRIDILVNNAAIFGRVKISKGVPFHELSMEEWNKVMAVNVTGVFLCCRAVFPYMKDQRSGKIINITSEQFYLGGGGGGGGSVKYAHYIAGKGAVIGLTRALARELGDHGINVNCMAPSSTFTEDASDQAAFEIRKKAVVERCIKRVQYPQDVLGTAIFLACSDSDFITGQTIAVNGGTVML
jgi:3-oxoacyl-[acyl-carrier protein] reductase